MTGAQRVNNAILWCVQLERRVVPSIRPLLDRLLRRPVQALVQWLINVRRRDEHLRLAEETVRPEEAGIAEDIARQMARSLARTALVPHPRGHAAAAETVFRRDATVRPCRPAVFQPLARTARAPAARQPEPRPPRHLSPALRAPAIDERHTARPRRRHLSRLGHAEQSARGQAGLALASYAACTTPWEGAMTMDGHTVARYSLAGIRLVNGVAALLAPQVVARRLGADPNRPALVYVLRMFGVRTVVLGAELLCLKDPDELNRALRVGTLIHTSDALSAAWAGQEGTLARRPAMAATAISTVNVALTFLAQRRNCCRPATR